MRQTMNSNASQNSIFRPLVTPKLNDQRDPGVNSWTCVQGSETPFFLISFTIDTFNRNRKGLETDCAKHSRSAAALSWCLVSALVKMNTASTGKCISFDFSFFKFFAFSNVISADLKSPYRFRSSFWSVVRIRLIYWSETVFATLIFSFAFWKILLTVLCSCTF